MNFDEIRPYHDHEVPAKIEGLLKEEQFQAVLQQVNPGLPFDVFLEKIKAVQTVKQFQAEIIVPILEVLLKKSTQGLSFDGIENLEKGKAYLFVSTHRDIVLDSALMNFVLLKEGFETAEIAIGDNLMKIPWIVDLVKLNKTFIVKRNVPKEEKVKASIELSSYINHTIKEKQNSIWIAQKSGRSKDGNDQTNPSLLKMFSLAAEEGSSIDKIKGLNICPISVAYEYNPCDILTLPELMTLAKGERYEKEPMEDLMHMGEGIEGQKGKVTVSFGKPINAALNELKDITNRNELLAAIAKQIDKQIHQTYHLMPSNYIAYDLLFNEDKFASNYSDSEKSEFEAYLKKRLEEFDGDSDFAHHTFLKMYANPVINSLKDQ
ncbi:MAG: 1-acyl-sn-glycerol-3-phosphate acyltransferase [Vicingaceae bacterium]